MTAGGIGRHPVPMLVGGTDRRHTRSCDGDSDGGAARRPRWRPSSRPERGTGARPSGHFHRLRLWNHVGRLSVLGDDGTEAVTVVGHHEHGDRARAARQTVSETIAFALGDGWFRRRTDARDDNGEA